MSAEKSKKKNLNGEIFHPSKEIIKQANIKEYEKTYQYSIKEREKFWAEQAGELNWFKKWNKVLDDREKPFYKWFTGGKINIVHNGKTIHQRSNCIEIPGKISKNNIQDTSKKNF